MAEPSSELQKIRRQKLEAIRALGFDPFTGTMPPGREEIASVLTKSLEDTVSVSGRIRAQRSHGQIVFADLEDRSGRIQILITGKELTAPEQGLVALLDLGDFIGVMGKLVKTQTGQLTVRVTSLTILTKSLRMLPSSWHGLKDTEERYRRRYLDLIFNPAVVKIAKQRSQIVDFLRSYLKKEGFLEVETPILQPLYGGASARPFLTHHHALDADLYLRISDELYLKRLIVGGLDKVFEIGHDFRNEGIDREHNPEFTVLEFYWAYRDYRFLMAFTEELLSSLVKEVTGDYKVTYQGREYNFKPPWPRLTFRDLILKDTGIDLDEVTDEPALLKAVNSRGLKLELDGVAGFGPVLDTLYKKFSRPRLDGPVFLINHPSSMRPLAKKLPENPKEVASFQLLVAGTEWLNAYNELNDPEDQRGRWEEEKRLAKKGLAEHQVLDEDYIEALEYGMPPTAGWGLGIDRVTAFLTDSHSLKETILFPTLKPEVRS